MELDRLLDELSKLTIEQVRAAKIATKRQIEELRDRVELLEWLEGALQGSPQPAAVAKQDPAIVPVPEARVLPLPAKDGPCPADNVTNLRRAAATILRHSGPQTLMQLAAQMNCTRGVMENVLRSSQFVKNTATGCYSVIGK